MTDKVRLEIDGAVATITNDNTDKHNAFDDEMDARLFEILDELLATPSVRAADPPNQARTIRSKTTCSSSRARFRTPIRTMV